VFAILGTGIDLTSIMPSGGWSDPKMPRYYTRELAAQESGMARMMKAKSERPLPGRESGDYAYSPRRHGTSPIPLPSSTAEQLRDPITTSAGESPQRAELSELHHATNAHPHCSLVRQASDLACQTA
jgi:hypothetical protein